MPTTIDELLDNLRATSLDERDKGDKFERLVKAYLSTEPEWTARFDNVWLWSEWPDRGSRTDTGIDLVAERRDGEGLAAIQCKFYAPGHRVAKSDIDSFISASARSEWTERYVFDTAAGWTNNAEETLDGVAQRIDIRMLDDARVDWSKYTWAAPDHVELAKAHQPRRHQQAAMDDIRAGLAEHDRGKLIMACGTGKTFTSLRIAEELVGEGGKVLFLVPSLQLLSQSLREWMAHTEVDIRPFAVCSDVRVGRKAADDSGDLSTIDLTEPATTDPQVLVDRMRTGRRAKGRMTVVFSTYQSIDVISQAQMLGLGEFDLVICDEAHRTTGVTLAGDDESHFVKVHDERFIQARKRLYMTATPRVFDDAVSKKALENDAVLADMGNEHQYGPELHRLGFGQAVEQNLLTDYKVVVLTIDENYVAEHFQRTMAEDGEIQLNDAAKLLGCWQGLAKNYGKDQRDTSETEAPMRRAVAFAQSIKASQTAARAFPALIERARLDESREITNDLRVQAVHVDGTMRIHERNAHLDWLKDEPADGTCRVLTNARCLSEGIDVPALDAVMFLTPRGSQVDVVQSVGRVMRKDPAGVKQRGYIILPVVVPSDMTPAEALNDNKRYKVVWQVLQALRSHDDRFHATVNQIALNSKKNTRIDIIDATPARTDDGSSLDRAGAGTRTATDGQDSSGRANRQLEFDFGFESFRDAMYARIVKKVGERTYWEDWANDIADIAQTHIVRITGLLEESSHARAEFEAFLGGLRGNLNESITPDQAIEMLAQHLITRPVFEALFAGYDFTAKNPVAQTMESMLEVLDEHALASENATLEKFYESVRRRVAGVDNAEGRQKILVELYNNFFARAFKDTVSQLGIVYTPIEVVDFILRSADEVLRQEFGQSLSDEGVHVLDGFTGTGTFIVRLLQLGLIEPHDLARKYTEEIHANEILLLAYYIAAVNIETTYADLAPEPEPFPGLVLTDTFQSYEDGDLQDLAIFPENNERIVRQRELPITVIVGNPPYVVGRKSGNDETSKNTYPSLDEAIRTSYVARSAVRSSRSLYDSYIRAIKWASLRIDAVAGRGVVAYVTNGGWIEDRSADGLRKTLVEEFSTIHVFNLRGNQMGAGEKSRREGGKIFGSGSRATVAIIVLVKNPVKLGPATIRYTDIGEYRTREEKLSLVAEARALGGLDARELESDATGDWLGQRQDTFSSFLEVGNKASGAGIFETYSLGLATGRDSWAYNSSSEQLRKNVSRMLDNFNEIVRLSKQDPTYVAPRDASQVSWNRNLEKHLERRQQLSASPDAWRVGQYRPFMKQAACFDGSMNAMLYLLPRLFPTSDHQNMGFMITTPQMRTPFSALAVRHLPDLGMFMDPGQFFPRWRYEPVDVASDALDLGASDRSNGVVIAGYRRLDNITDDALEQFRAAHADGGITKDDVFFFTYGVLHSPQYRAEYEADLTKALPRIPFVSEFGAFVHAGRKLAELHMDYEQTVPFRLGGLDIEPAPGSDAYAFYSVGSKKMRFGAPTAEQKSRGEKKDRTTIHFNDRITLSGVPDEAYRYMIGSRSAIEWIFDRYLVKTDPKSGIVNDPNDWSREVGDPRYILDLLARVVTVSVETMKIVDALPPLEILGSASQPS